MPSAAFLCCRSLSPRVDSHGLAPPSRALKTRPHRRLTRARQIRAHRTRAPIRPPSIRRPADRPTQLKLRRPTSRPRQVRLPTIQATLRCRHEQATEPPPPLPDYDQPPAPADGYIWTPGYWAWGPGGYYWVPGAWVEPPYTAALWTPGYWGFYGGRYLFYPGHWGLHIGFYGGINYGFGYIGFGYEGGYWNGGHFFYNRAYNHINVRTVHNMYNYNAGNRGNYNARQSRKQQLQQQPQRQQSAPQLPRRSAACNTRPQPSEGAAAHEPTAPRMNTQVQHAQTYGGVRGQYAAQNHGRPATPAISRPIPADHSSAGPRRMDQADRAAAARAAIAKAAQLRAR